MKIDCDVCLVIDFVSKNKKVLFESSQTGIIFLSRHYLHGFGLNEIREIQLHGFSDTSVKSLAAVIYLRFILIDGSMFTSLVPSKMKVILIKKLKSSVLHLELLACSLLIKLLKNILYSLNLVCSDIKLYCWTDSTDCVFLDK